MDDGLAPGAIKITKLKTLKDMKWPIESGTHPDFVKIRELKEEAIKWVKDLRYYDQELEERHFMEFHNITEDDLK